MHKKFNKYIYLIKKKLGLLKPDEYLDYLRGLGVSIGKGTHAFTTNIVIDTQRPWMIRIGEYCKITSGVIILQHDYSRSVLRRVYGDVVGESKKTVIGNNVFIGMNSIILMGSNVGDNVIIGAGSVVSGHIPSNVVVAGNPARVIRTLEEHYNIRKQKYINEAKNQAKIYYEKFGKFPSIEDMGSFFPLYLERTIHALRINRIRTKLSGDCEQEVIDEFLQSKPVFSNYKDFLANLNNNTQDEKFNH